MVSGTVFHEQRSDYTEFLLGDLAFRQIGFIAVFIPQFDVACQVALLAAILGLAGLGARRLRRGASVVTT